MLAEQAVRKGRTPYLNATEHGHLSDDEFQAYMLQGVSRTFALTIPELPQEVARVVANAYLLCRIADTLEDEPALDTAQKYELCRQFIDVVGGTVSPYRFSAELSPLLSHHTLPTVHELIRSTPRVIAIIRRFTAAQQDALLVCVRVMAQGMAEFQASRSLCGLDDLAHLDRYCYHVAGVVGEMLTKLFCEYSPEISKHRSALLTLAVSFGQGLQMTNILKDIWDDHSRGACWLPRDVFAELGFDLHNLAPGRYHESFGEGLGRLIAIAHGHLRNALAYTLLIPPHETGIRNFCLWALGMALLTLRKINRHRDFDTSRAVKISRRSVGATRMTCRMTASHDRTLRLLFRLTALGLPPAIEGRYAGGLA